MRTAVLGCSHSAGYSYSDAKGTIDRWNENNWAEIYINNQDKDGVIFACPGRGWYDYSERLAFLFKTYKDIENTKVTFIGRCGMYVYIDMHQAVMSSLACLLYTSPSPRD